MYLQPTGDTMVFHPEFEQAGQRSGLQVWRVESLDLVPVPESLYGGFYSGDAYLVLHTTTNRRGDHQHDLHFWQGTTTRTNTTENRFHLRKAAYVFGRCSCVSRRCQDRQTMCVS